MTSGAPISVRSLSTCLILRAQDKTQTTYTKKAADHKVLGEKVLATVPNINVLLSDVLFMEVLQPSAISYTYKIRPAKNFGTSFKRKYKSIELTVADPYHGCSHLTNAHFIEGTIVLMQRGECSFVTKAVHAEEAGAVAVVITDNDIRNDQSFIDMIDDNTERVVNIPATFLLGKDGHTIKSTLERLRQPFAMITIPINVTGANVYQVNQPPWTLWHTIKSTLERLRQPFAMITIPINVTGANVYQVNQPPWTLW